MILPLGDPVSDVVFLLGEPDNTDTVGEFPRYAYYQHSGYSNSGDFYVSFDEEIVSRLHPDCFFPKNTGISCGQEVNDVIKIFGEPKSISRSADRTGRIYNYPQKNASIFMERGRVKALSIANGSNIQFDSSAE